jgi:carbonic anhydrase
MKKLLAGIADFHRSVRPAYRDTFARLALGQAPDCLFVACSDSRVVPNLFASTDPGDLFVVRNVGNLVPPCGGTDCVPGDPAEGAAVEFALNVLEVQDVIVCGHSQCGAMRALVEGQVPDGAPHLRAWLEAGRRSLERLGAPSAVGEGLSTPDRLSQLNVLQQLEHLRTYPAVRERVAEGRLGLHAWWFDLADARVLAFDAASGRFAPIVRDDG